MTRTIDLTPTWAAAMQIYAAALEDGTGEGRAAARKELARVAEILDNLNREAKASREVYEVLTSHPERGSFAAYFTRQDAADAYTDRLSAEGYQIEGTCAFDAHAEASPAMDEAAKRFGDPSLRSASAAQLEADQ